MGWILCIVFLAAYLVLKIDVMLIACGLFAISGAISYVGIVLNKIATKQNDKKE